MKKTTLIGLCWATLVSVANAEQPLYDVPELLKGKPQIEKTFGDLGECVSEPFEGKNQVRCNYPIEKIDIFYVDEKPKSVSFQRGAFSAKRRIDQMSLELFGIENNDRGRIRHAHLFSLTWVSDIDNIEVHMFGDGTGKMTHAHITRIKY